MVHPSDVDAPTAAPAARGTNVAYPRAGSAGCGIPTFMPPVPIQIIGTGVSLADHGSDESLVSAVPMEITRPRGAVPASAH